MLEEMNGRPHHHGLYDELIRCLAKVMRCEFAVIGVLDESGTRVVPFSVLDRHDPEAMTYDIAGTPCEVTLEQGSLFVRGEIRFRFPEDHHLREFDADAYAGVTFTDPMTGRAGLLAVLMREIVCGEEETISVLGAFAECIKTAREAELLQNHFQREAQEQRLYADVLSALNKSGPLEDRVREAMGAMLQFPEYTAFRVVRFDAGKVVPLASVPEGTAVGDGVGHDEIHRIASRMDKRGIAPLGGECSEGTEDRTFVSPIHHDEAVLGAIVFEASPSFDRRMTNRILPRYVNDMLAASIVRDQLEMVLQQSIEEAKHSGEVKARFLAKMSHELRSPINAILGFADILGEDAGASLTRTQRDQIDGIRRNAGYLLSMISDVLEMGDIRADVFKAERKPCSVASICNKVIARHTTAALGKGIVLRAELEGMEQCVLHTDEAMLEQILDNLVSNAVKYTPRGRAVLRVSRNELEGAVVFEVADTGIGIPGDLLEHIFEPFTQVNESYRRRFEGLGLGLPICSQLAERLGGRLDVRSTRGEGSVFTFTLPQRESDSTAAQGAGCASPTTDTATIKARGRAFFEKTRVLVVEDSVDNRTLFDFYLRKIGAEPVFA
ncbi:MAG TPA: hypothetical protein ENK11_08065, partial [Phycisphaerales bacterium]|nr:hypothetical protein [Phycisphaerales bacterium]